MNYQKQNWHTPQEVHDALSSNNLNTLKWAAKRYLLTRANPMKLTKVTAKDFLKATEHWN